MTARLTDEDIGDQLWLNSGNGTLVELLAELQARRAADLTAEETDSIIRLRNELRSAERRSPDVMYYPAHHIEARKALDEILRGGRVTADLTAEDVEALRSIVEAVNEWGCVCVSDVALSVVRRIIASGGGQ